MLGLHNQHFTLMLDTPLSLAEVPNAKVKQVKDQILCCSHFQIAVPDAK